MSPTQLASPDNVTRRLDQAPRVLGPELPLRVALVDDDLDYRSLVGVVLRANKYVVDEYSDPVTAFEAIGRGGYDIVVTDYRMPALSGLDLIRQLRALGLAIPCLLMSSVVPLHESDLEALIGPGATLQKCYPLRGFCEKIEGLVALHPSIRTKL